MIDRDEVTYTADALRAMKREHEVVEPHMSGIGGDCFVMYSPMAGTPLAFNGSGRAPAGAKCEWYSERNFSEIPEQSPHAVTVPGAIDAWCQLLADHGTKDLYEVLTPANPPGNGPEGAMRSWEAGRVER
jgi:gamma-glutamyltranspeptidase/glutathione hydrolase